MKITRVAPARNQLLPDELITITRTNASTKPPFVVCTRAGPLAQARQPQDFTDNIVRQPGDELPGKIEVEPSLRPQQRKNEQRGNEKDHAIGLEGREGARGCVGKDSD